MSVRRLACAHFCLAQAPDGALNLLVLCPPDPVADRALLRLGGRYHPRTWTWEFDAAAQPEVLAALLAAYGAQQICIHCALELPCPLLVARLRPPAPRANRGGAAGRTTPAPVEMSRGEAARVLGVAPDAPLAEIRRAFAARALQSHPDTGGSDAAMRRVVAARAALTRAEGRRG